jgi:NAD(P)H-dependent FMN reductase
MNLHIFNGSPRRKKSNSKILADHFLQGYRDVLSDEVPVHYLASIKKSHEHIEAFKKADTVLFILPLYTDCMPGIVKIFLEQISGQEGMANKSIGFIVQSGFPEVHHSVFLEKYLHKWTQRMQCHYLGTVIKGGVEGIQVQPPRWTRKLFGLFHDLGKVFARTGSFDKDIMKKLATPYALSAGRRLLFRILAVTGLTNYYWNMKLKQYDAYGNRFDRPYSEESPG